MTMPRSESSSTSSHNFAYATHRLWLYSLWVSDAAFSGQKMEHISFLPETGLWFAISKTTEAQNVS